MRELNLYRVWEIMNRLSYEESKLSEEQDKYVSLLGLSSNYSSKEFNNFLDYYSFQISGENIIVFNDDKIAYEDFTVDDFSFFPLYLLSFGEKELKDYIKNEINNQLKQQEIEKLVEKENLKQRIEMLQKQLNNL